MSLQGADPAVVRRALEDGTALPGTGGFAGVIDGLLVRDVLGRYPLFYDADEPGNCGWRPAEVARPRSLPAGSVLEDGTIREVWTLPTVEPFAADRTAVECVRTAIEDVLDAIKAGGLAIAFSGGVDSALLAAWLDAPLYTVGFPESQDIERARTVATALGCQHTVIELDHDRLEAAIPAVAEAIDRTNAMDVQIALGQFLVADRVAADGFDRLALGQGADELFGGYAKVAKAPSDPRLSAETVRGARREVMASLPDQLERDTLAVRAHGIEPVMPLLHDTVVHAALGLSGDQLVRSDGTRKWALREAASAFLPQSLASADKKAMQYGSLIAREVDRLARQAGFKRRMDDHVTQYIEDRC